MCGNVFRDPREWIEGLKFNRNLEPEVLVSAGAKPLVGKEEIRKRLEGYLDGPSFVLDQSLRGILGGKGPDDLRDLVRLPDYLKKDWASIPSNSRHCEICISGRNDPTGSRLSSLLWKTENLRKQQKAL